MPAAALRAPGESTGSAARKSFGLWGAAGASAGAAGTPAWGALEDGAHGHPGCVRLAGCAAAPALRIPTPSPGPTPPAWLPRPWHTCHTCARLARRPRESAQPAGCGREYRWPSAAPADSKWRAVPRSRGAGPRCSSAPCANAARSRARPLQRRRAAGACCRCRDRLLTRPSPRPRLPAAPAPCAPASRARLLPARCPRRCVFPCRPGPRAARGPVLPHQEGGGHAQAPGGQPQGQGGCLCSGGGGEGRGCQHSCWCFRAFEQSIG